MIMQILASIFQTKN